MAPTVMIGGLDGELLDGIVARAAAPGFDRFQAQLRSSGYCARPVRLRGEVCDHNGVRVWSTAEEPDGVLRKRAGTAARPCARHAPSATVRTPTI
jgi:hypothetical protein